MTQEDVIFNHLKKYGTITTLEAFNLYGITRLSAKIFDLKKKGAVIEDEIIKGKNRLGHETHWKKYKLIGAENGEVQ